MREDTKFGIRILVFAMGSVGVPLPIAMNILQKYAKSVNDPISDDEISDYMEEIYSQTKKPR